MKAERRTPSGLETGFARGPYAYHGPLDNTCESLEVESLPFGCGGWQSDLLDDMQWRPAAWLDKHYPELVFGRVATKKLTKGHAYHTDCGKTYRVADWRTA